MSDENGGHVEHFQGEEVDDVSQLISGGDELGDDEPADDSVGNIDSVLNDTTEHDDTADEAVSL